MATEEKKEETGQEKAENEAAEQELVDQGAAGEAPLDGETAEPEAGGEEPEEEDTAAGKKEKKFWLLSLGLILLLLAGGGFYAVTGMRQAAHKLGGGSDYDQLSANSTIYDGGAGTARNANYFPLDEDAARAQSAGGPKGDRVNPSIIRTREELVAEASGKRAAQGATAKAVDGSSSSPEDNAGGAASPGQAAMAEKLQARAAMSGGAMGLRSAKNSPASASGSAGAFQGNGTVVGRATAQSETKSSTPKGAGRGSVVEGLRSAFKASFYGARLSSKDSARGWIARSFDGTAEPDTAIEYEEGLRKLDKVNPGSIPGFLRDQDMSADEAKRLTVSEVAKPKLDKDGTKEALAGDKDYQAKKMAQEFSGSMINGIFKGFSGDGPPGDGGGGGPGSLGRNGPGAFTDPGDEADLDSLGLTEYLESTGFGEECGCSEAAPCCCLPQNSASQNCPAYGPFLPNDPCGEAMYGGGNTGGVMAGQ
ncbi:MAG: hypothetical protein Q8O90_00545 [Elusimicrobiota bacterium]|nr:hypothetical protein [Elusimicrobiota bacterium]